MCTCTYVQAHQRRNLGLRAHRLLVTRRELISRLSGNLHSTDNESLCKGQERSNQQSLAKACTGFSAGELSVAASGRKLACRRPVAKVLNGDYQWKRQASLNYGSNAHPLPLEWVKAAKKQSTLRVLPQISKIPRKGRPNLILLRTSQAGAH
ncbi:hypothetical protein DUNSADRAFT_1519 [Dunaliella salina]|uniref:Encoded protein n=1 Tax=Dunaliella salina TaxID=3046 RepID=A0ABQ7GWX7_DUNSA|nr:hypothetical protein DUNSADRAFT_1519 [Dunaliella salina]|eukprot:KAF5839121.1 hypothetical protein DUNSADRAFT_1519 [Dunaliella salina]